MLYLAAIRCGKATRFIVIVVSNGSAFRVNNGIVKVSLHSKIIYFDSSVIGLVTMDIETAREI